MEDDRSGAQAAYCSVTEAAARLGRSTQTVRNLIRSGALTGRRVERGRRSDIYQVLLASLDAYATELSSSPRELADRTGSRLDNIERRLERLERQARESSSKFEEVSLRYANLRLMEIQEDYDRAVQELQQADAHRSEAAEALRRIGANYRSALQQFHLPDRLD